MKIKTPYIVLIVLLLLTSGIYGIKAENQINSQKAELATLQQTIQQNNDQISTLVKNNASQSAQIKALLAQPTPTPVIETHYVSQPSNPTPTLTSDQAATAFVLKLMEESAQHPAPIIQSPQRSTTSTCYPMAFGGGMTCTSD
jgi:septal ring factor EnvC (AmiA/AmiB activator)